MESLIIGDAVFTQEEDGNLKVEVYGNHVLDVDPSDVLGLAEWLTDKYSGGNVLEDLESNQ